MAEWWIAVAAGIASVCLLVMTAILWITAQDVRRTMRRANAALSRCDRIARDVQRFVVRTDHAARQLEGVMRRACEAASGVMDQMESWQEVAQTWWTRSFGTQARSGPRRNGHG